jgi:hypothetical protein
MASGSRQSRATSLMFCVFAALVLFALPIARADAYAVAPDRDLTTISEQRSVTVHVSEPGRYVLHVSTSGEVRCADCDDHVDRVNLAESTQRFAVTQPHDPVSADLTNVPAIDVPNRLLTILDEQDVPPPRS